jgi:hypothetical protein
MKNVLFVLFMFVASVMGAQNPCEAVWASMERADMIAARKSYGKSENKTLAIFAKEYNKVLKPYGIKVPKDLNCTIAKIVDKICK